MHYIRLAAASPLPTISLTRPFKALVIIDETAPAERRLAISRWLVAAGCRFLLVWGRDCRAWDEYVHQVSDDRNNASAAVDDAQVVMTTFHDRESLRDLCWFARYAAMHPCVELEETAMIHLSATDRERELRAIYASV